jgi:PPP family 3-phenylpropionic acid transporter
MVFNRLRLQYLMSFGLTGSFMPYSPLFLKQVGLSEAQIGYVQTVFIVGVLVMPVVITYLADKHVPNRVLLLGQSVLTALTLLLFCSVNGFVSALVAMTMFAMVSTSMNSLIDGLTFAVIHKHEQTGRPAPPYHSLRLWGSVGFILPTVVLYVLLRAFPERYWIAMVTGAASATLGALSSLLLPVMERPPGEEPKRVPTAEAFSALKNKQVLAFVGSLFFTNAAMYAFYNFYGLRLRQVGIDGSWVGVITSIGVVAEIVVMLISGRVLHLIGVKGVLLMGAVSVMIRMSLLAVTDHPAVLIATQLLHGPIVMCVHLVPPMYLNTKASAATRNSMQGMYVVLCYGVARFFGSIASGHAAEYDLRWVFAFAASMGLIAFVWATLAFREDAQAQRLARRTVTPIEEPVPEAP